MTPLDFFIWAFFVSVSTAMFVIFMCLPVALLMYAIRLANGADKT